MTADDADLRRAARYAISCGLGAGIASQAMLAVAAWQEGEPLTRPINATSHWLWGDAAGRRTSADLAHTGLGFATNQASALFWGTVFGLYLASRRDREAGAILRDAAAMGVLATTLDYGLLPRRLTPGWELALSKRSVGLALAATALGLGLGGIFARAMEK